MADDDTRPANPPPPDDLTGRTIDERYRVRRRLGAGGMGEVYLVEDLRLDSVVALKRLSPHLRFDLDYRRDLEEEAQRAFELQDNPNVASLFNIFESSGETFLVMEYVEGLSLRERIRKPVTIAEFLHIAIQCCIGLQAAHQRRILHRDIKPANVMLTPEGRVKICDFGLARRLPTWSAGKTPHAHGEGATTVDAGPGELNIAGTPAYMAPEVFAGNQPDQRADIFLLGVVFYELLAHQNPFAGGTYREVRHNVERKVPPPLRDFNSRVQPELEGIISRMLAKSASGRYSSVAELLLALKQLKRWIEWKPRFLAAAAAAVLVLVAVSAPVQRWMGFGSEVATLVVLPFESETTSPEEQAYSYGFAGGITDQIGALVPRTALQVIPASEVWNTETKTADEAAAQFSATHVLSASLFHDEGVVRVVYEVVDPASGLLVGGGEVDAPGVDPFALRERMVGEILTILWSADAVERTARNVDSRG